jgi:hypothetical protein
MLQHGCRRRTISAKEGVHGQRQDEVADLNGLGGQVADLHGPPQAILSGTRRKRTSRAGPAASESVCREPNAPARIGSD